MNDISLTEQLKTNFAQFRYDSSHGFFDWFCKDESLENRCEKLIAKLMSIIESTKIKKDKYYVFFKNNCPCVGDLYDDFRICDLESGEVIYTIVPKSGRTGKAEVWGKENEFKEPIMAGSWWDVKKFFRM